MGGGGGGEDWVDHCRKTPLSWAGGVLALWSCMHLTAGRAGWKGRLTDLDVPDAGCIRTDPLQWQVMARRREARFLEVFRSAAVSGPFVKRFTRWSHPGLAYCVPSQSPS